MGGNAFDGVFMPRMPPDVYKRVLREVQAQLRTVYAQVETPIEGPGKKDYGDIDALVLAKDGTQPPTTETLMDLLGALDSTGTPNSKTKHFALPWPSSGDGTARPDTTSSRRPLIQVDVHLCASASELQYTLFQHAHGDMWNILWTVLRPFGFTSSLTGFYYVVDELKHWNKTLAKVQLTDDPDTVLEYFGMDARRYWAKFADWDEAMDYAGTCRFYDPGRGKHFDDQDVKEKLDIKAKDRMKRKQRPMYKYWLEEYLPGHRGDPVGDAARMNKEEIFEDVRRFFGDEAARRIQERRETGMRAMALEQLWSDVRKSLDCTGSDLTHAMKGLKLEIAGDVPPEDVDRVASVRKAFEDGEYDTVKKWVDNNWQDVRDRSVARDREKSTQKLREHLEKRGGR